MPAGKAPLARRPRLTSAPDCDGVQMFDLCGYEEAALGERIGDIVEVMEPVPGVERLAGGEALEKHECTSSVGQGIYGCFEKGAAHADALNLRLDGHTADPRVLGMAQMYLAHA